MRNRYLNKSNLSLCLLAMLYLLAACTPGLSERAEDYRPSGQFSASGVDNLPDKWWLSFGDQSLNNLVDRALQDNLSLKSTWDRLDQANALARKAGAGLWPQLTAEADISKSRSHDGTSTTSSRNTSLALAASYEIDLWGRIRSSSQAARLDAMGSIEDLKTAALTLSAQVATTWFQLLEQQEQVELLKAQITTNRQTLELVNLQFRTGQVGIADVLQQRLVLENRQGEIVLAKAQEVVLENQISILLGMTPGSLSQAPGKKLISLPRLPNTGVYSDLLNRRPDIRSAWLDLQAADQRVAVAVADRFPRLSLNGRASTSGEDIADLFDNWLTNLAANLVAPLIDGNRRRAEADRAMAEAAESLHAYGQTVLTAIAEVEEALILEQRQLEHLESIDRQLILAEQATERIRDRYLNGIENYQRVLASTLSVQQLQRARLSAHSGLLTNRIKLCRALAGGWEMTRSSSETNITR